VFSFSVTNVHAEDFSKNEDKYITLCSSSNLTKDKESVCRKFNDYLKNKNSSIAQSITDQQDDLATTKNQLKSLDKKINELEDRITKLEKEISYVQKNISKLQTQIKKKNQLIGERMYSMQDVYNSEAFITYVFRAQSVKDVFSRIASLTQLTDYEEELAKGLKEDQRDLKEQEDTLSNSQAALTREKRKTKSLQKKAVKLKAEQELKLAKTKNEKTKLTAAQAKIDAALDAMIARDSTSTVDYTGGVGKGSETGKKICEAALSKLGKRYWWGKTGPDYFDCSGLVYWAHNAAGVSIGRQTAAGYAKAGVPVSSASLSAGDIITFSYGSGVAHVGIYLGNGYFVHASGKGSGTVGQDPNQCVKVSKLAGRWQGYVYNYRRLY
jgi:cell wall-associated NlpC family hydrolase